MTTLWVAIVAVALANAATKAAGPLLIGDRDLPPRLVAVIALLAALVVTETFGEDRHLVIDERTIGVAVAGLVLALRGPVLLAVALAAITTALARAFG